MPGGNLRHTLGGVAAALHPSASCLSAQHVAASSGSGGADLQKLCAVLDAVPALSHICLDVANGYSEYFVEFVKTVREKFPKHTIMVRPPGRVLPWRRRPWLTGLFCVCRLVTW